MAADAGCGRPVPHLTATGAAGSTASLLQQRQLVTAACSTFGRFWMPTGPAQYGRCGVRAASASHWGKAQVFGSACIAAAGCSELHPALNMCRGEFQCILTLQLFNRPQLGNCTSCAPRSHVAPTDSNAGHVACSLSNS